MKKNSWKMVIQLLISILTALATTLVKREAWAIAQAFLLVMQPLEGRRPPPHGGW